MLVCKQSLGYKANICIALLEIIKIDETLIAIVFPIIIPFLADATVTNDWSLIKAIHLKAGLLVTLETINSLLSYLWKWQESFRITVQTLQCNITNDLCDLIFDTKN